MRYNKFICHGILPARTTPVGRAQLPEKNKIPRFAKIKNKENDKIYIGNHSINII